MKERWFMGCSIHWSQFQTCEKSQILKSQFSISNIWSWIFMFLKCILKPEQWWESLLSCKCGQCDNMVQLSIHICISSTTSIQETQKNYIWHAIWQENNLYFERGDEGREGETEEDSDGDGDGDGHREHCNAFMATPWQNAHLNRRQPNSHLLQSSVLPSSLSLLSNSRKSDASSSLCTELHTNAKLHLLPHERLCTSLAYTPH